MKTMLLLLALAAGTTNATVHAGNNLGQDEIRALVQQGKILSLEAILRLYPEKVHGKLLDLGVEHEHGNIIYELEFLQRDGHVVEFEIDAADGSLIKQEIEN
ncbi:MAG: peptidase M4 [Gammaproteobacteria bacterium]|nr:peptidase M4 [Gammaproteobacteria bacterium]MDH3537905.1 peptidase M4 [Gammaproteobacteria bacterium]